MTATDMEAKIVGPLELELANSPHGLGTRSTTTDDGAVIALALPTEAEAEIVDVKRRLATKLGELPRMSPPVVQLRPGPIVARIIAFSQTLPAADVRARLWAASGPLAEALGVGRIELCGGAVKGMVTLDPMALTASGIALDDMIGGLQTAINRGMGALRFDDLASLEVAVRDAQIRLRDVATLAVLPAADECMAADARGPVVELVVRSQAGVEPQVVRDGLPQIVAELRRAVPVAITIEQLPNDPPAMLSVAFADQDPDLGQCTRALAIVRDAVASVPGVARMIVSNGTMDALEPSDPRIDVTVWPASAEQAVHDRLGQLPPGLIGFAKASPVVELRGTDRAALVDAVRIVENKLAGQPGFAIRGHVGLSTFAGAGATVDRSAAERLGVDVAAVGHLAALASGLNVGWIAADNGYDVPCVLRVADTPPYAALGSMPVHTASGNVPLRQIAALHVEAVPRVFVHRNRWRALGIRVEIAADHTRAELAAAVAAVALPAGITAAVVDAD